jgi:tetratricopeptide (TPR) repeat protein
MDGARDGQVVTFYSFKGGTGRTMALANVAWILAAAGKRVLVVDWDLESPGLHRFFHPFLPPGLVRDTPGVVDLIRTYTNAAVKAARNAAARAERGADLATARAEEFAGLADFARVEPYAVSLEWPFPDGGTLDFMSSGQQNYDYSSAISGLDWENIYDRLGGSRLFQAMRADMKDRYDYTLIDSRTGFSDISDICTGHLPDTVVDCFTLSTQGIEGAAQLTRKLRPELDLNRREIRVLPVPMRVENAEQAKAEAGLAYARTLFTDLPADFDTAQRTEYWRQVGVPYRPFYAFEEILSVFGDEFGGPLTLLGAYQRLTAYITRGEVRDLPQLDPREREQWRRRYERRGPAQITAIDLDYEPEDEIWAEWLRRVLTEAGISVSDPRDPREGERETAAPSSSATVLAIISPAYREARRSGRIPRGRPWPQSVRAVYITEMRPLERFPAADSAQLAGLRPNEMVDRITTLVGAESLPNAKLRSLIERFPENDPTVRKLPARNSQFTGRTADLRTLRETLRDKRTAIVGQVTIGGMAGVGKTQLAIEYAHRYRSLYDVIWWIPAGQPQFIDAALFDLGREMTARLGADVGLQTGITGIDIARNVLRALSRNDPTNKWLLIFDNAEDPAEVQPFLPSGAGHVIITSRDNRWLDLSQRFEIDVFVREESITHLRERVKNASISVEEADRIAFLLGDLPLAVATTGAWLFETGQSAQDLLQVLEQYGTRPAVGSPFSEQGGPIAAWGLSLDQVAAKSGAAYRLLQVCSVLSPDGVALDLVNSTEMAAALTRLGPDAVESGDVARLVQQINRFALIKLDPEERQLQVHRVLQEVVEWRTSKQDAERIRHEVHSLLAQWTPDGDPDEPRTWPRYRMLWPHLESAGAVSSELESVRELFINRVRYQWARGDQKRGQETADMADAAWTAVIAADPDSADAAVLRRQLLHLRFNKANTLRSDARLQEAFQLDREVWAEQERLLGPRHRHTLMTAGSLTADLRALGRYREALELAQRTYDAWLDEYGPDFRRTVDAGTNLAVSLRLAGNYERARVLDEIGFAWLSRVLSDTHHRTLSSANCIGLDMREAGRYEESVTRLREHLETARKAGESSSRVGLQLQVNLAASLRATGRSEEARHLLEEANSRYEAQFGAQDPDALICRLSMANVLLSADEAEAADLLSRSLLVTLRGAQSFGEQHPLTLVAANNHVAVLRALHALPAAVDSAHTTVDLLRQVLGEDHPFTLAAAMNLAVCTAEIGELVEARALDVRTVEALADLVGVSHPDTLRARANLALTRIELGESGAREEQPQIAAELGQQIGRNHPSVVALQSGRRAHRLLDGQPI